MGSDTGLTATGSTTGGTAVATGSGTGAGSATDTGSTTGGPKFDLPVPDMGGEVAGGIPETCIEAETFESTVGCLFYGIDTDLVGPNDALQFAIAVANVQLTQSANVTVEQYVNNAWTPVGGAAVMVDALDLHVFLPPEGQHINATGVRPKGAFRITSDVPIAAYQFNPYEAGKSFTSDASLLYPVPAWDTLHYVLNTPKINSAQESQFTVVAAEDGTLVTVTPSVATEAGGEVPAGTPGVPFDVNLDEGDMVQFAVADALANPLGTRVESNPDHPIAVFNGNTCASIPAGAAACDHLQTQLFGVRQWGSEFVGSRMPVRSTQFSAEPSFWQILASEDGTAVTLTASAGVLGLPASPVMLDQGESVEFMSEGTLEEPGDFMISSTKPIAVASYMTGTSTVNDPNTEPSKGDPAVVQLSPIEQFLPRYVVLIPPSFWMTDVGTITRPLGAEVRVDGTPIPDADFAPVGADFEVARVVLADGIHVLEGDEAFSIIVAGYDAADSYAYLGGTGTAVINPTPEG